MSSVAEQIRTAREARNLTIQQVAEITKMRTDHIRALEEGNYDVFSAPVYIRGFVRTYSGLLKLDTAQLMAVLDTELGKTKNFAEPPPLTDSPKGVLDFLMLQLSKISWRKGAVIGIGVAILAILITSVIVYRYYRTADPLKTLPPGVYRPTNQVGDTLALPQARPRR